ncbi:hypothetical protein IJT93_03265 [bacterium]|nr:hypothetical protein [bacterium]
MRINLSNKIWALIPFAAALNIICGWISAFCRLPLYLDSIGTVLAACLAGPAAGVLTAVTANLVSVFTGGPAWLFFLPTAAVLGWSAGKLAKLGMMNSKSTAAAAGLLLGIICAACSAPIASELLQGSTGGGTDLLTAAFRAMGLSRLQACFAQSMSVDPLDKAISCLLAQILLSGLPASILSYFDQEGTGLGFRRSADSYKPYASDDARSGETAPLTESESCGLGLYIKEEGFLHRVSLNAKWLLLLIAFTVSLRLPIYLKQLIYGLPSEQSPEALKLYVLSVLPVFMGLLLMLAIFGKIAVPFAKITVCAVLPLCVSMICINGFLSSPDSALEIWQGFSLPWSEQAAWQAASVSLKIALVFEALILLLMTTTPQQIMKDLERKGVPPRFAHTVSATLYLLPKLTKKTRQILEARLTRALPWSSSKFQQLKIWLSIVTPLILSVVWESQQRAMALEARGFGIRSRTGVPSGPPASRQDKITVFLLVLIWLILLALPTLQTAIDRL